MTYWNKLMFNSEKTIFTLKYDPSYYEEVCELWKQHGWNAAVPPQCLPDGYIAISDGKVIAACFVFLASNAKMAVVDYAVIDKYASKEISHMALYRVIQRCTSTAKDHVGNNGIVMTLSSNPHIFKFFEQNGFVKAESGVTTMILPLEASKLDFIKE